ncbi:MAG TPA: lantibiotic dehydratase [Ktedonobacteraceae bacterium]|nr:lantibiotic dehydratase [Ktedonobacteraceae bacterium]
MQKPVIRELTDSPQNACSPLFLLRIGGQPIDVVDALRFEEVARWRDAILAIETTLFRSKDRLVDVLHEAVNTHKENQKLRRQLIELKRTVFNMRAPANSTQARLLVAALPAQQQDLLSEWLDWWDRYQQLASAGTDILARELRRKRALLKEAISGEDFRKGILLSSPLLDEAISAYIGSDNLQLNREARTVERSLVEYLLRTACKTSPFSTLTSVCPGTFEYEPVEAESDVIYQIESMEKRSFPKLNVALLSRLSYLILSDAPDEVRKELPVCLTSGWWRQGNRIKYLRRRKDVEEIDENAPTILDIIHENIFYLPAGRIQEEILEILSEGRTAKVGDLVVELCARGAGRRSEREVEAYLFRLLRLGFLLVPNLQLDIHHENPLTRYSCGLVDMQTPLTDRLADELGVVERLVAAYGTAPLETRRELLAAVKRQIKQCYALLGQADMQLPRTLIYEDTTLKSQKLALPVAQWDTVLANLGELERLLPVFDASLAQKLITRGYFRAKYGAGQRCDDFLLFADTINADYFEQYRRDMATRKLPGGAGVSNQRDNPFRQPEISRLDEARQTVSVYVREAYTRMQDAPGSEELILSDDFRVQVATHLPENGETLQSNTFFSQFVRIGGEPSLVINQVYAGLTLMFSRFAHCFAGEDVQVVETLRALLETLQPSETVFAELKGGYEATNLNLHPVVTPYELVCPGELSTRPQEEQIPLADLYIQDDVQQNSLRLYSRRLGKEVIPVYLGFLIPMLLPEIQQILLNFSRLSICTLNLWDGVTVASREDGITFYPRLRYKHVVLQRAMWQMPVSLLPQRESGQSDADYYLAVSRWRKAHGLPTRVFFSTHAAKDASSAASDAQDKMVKSRKPLYVDFENYFSLALLEATARKMAPEQQVALTEMLPGREDLWFEKDGRSYVSEFVLEVNQAQQERQ